MRFVLPVLALVTVVVGCGSAKYAEEKTTLTAMTKAMETFSAAVAAADTPEALADAVGAFSTQIEQHLPLMKELGSAHPEWETSPPDALKETLDSFNAASQGVRDTMPKVMHMAQEFGDNETLRSAMEKFGGLMSQL